MVKELAKRAKKASLTLREAESSKINEAILRVADKLEANIEQIVAANQIDMENGAKNGLPTAKLDRLMLDETRIKGVAGDVRNVAGLADVLGHFSGSTLTNGLRISKVVVPLGVIGMIYESRPNVTVDASVLALKSGNAALLRGGREAYETNRALANLIGQALDEAGLPKDSILLVEDLSREAAREMMECHEYLDLLIPRGGKNLIDTVKQYATVPMIETGSGNCHLYIDKFADIKKALAILVNAKTQRPSVCNAVESLLVHQQIAAEFLPVAKEALAPFNVELRGCEQTQKIIDCQPATEEDYATEYHDLILSIKVVADVTQAVDHVNTYGTQHSDAIVTENTANAKQFLTGVDSAAVYHNVSTRFSDGAQFGLGAEIGISTQKLHVRGPFAYEALTSFKYVIEGDGQIRG